MAKNSFVAEVTFNIYINDIFLFPDNVCLRNYGDDTTLYLIGENHNTNRNILNKNFLSQRKWFYDNYMVLNPSNCCYMSFSSNPDKSDLILATGGGMVVVMGGYTKYFIGYRDALPYISNL